MGLIDDGDYHASRDDEALLPRIGREWTTASRTGTSPNPVPRLVPPRIRLSDFYCRGLADRSYRWRGFSNGHRGHRRHRREIEERREARKKKMPE